MSKKKPKLSAATRAHINGPHDERAAARGCYFDESHAAHVCEFFELYLKHSKGSFAGKPFSLMPWQRKDLLEPLFGWKRPDGTRRFRVGYVSMAKKNGKSTTCAGINLYMLVGDGEQSAEVYAAAKDRKQAGIIYREASSMVKKSDVLGGLLDDIASQKRLVFESTGSFLVALSGDAGSNEGINAHAVIVDELHEHRNRELWDTLRYSGDARDQPLILAITTAGWDRESICYEQYAYAKGVLNGTIDDDAFFALIYEAAPPEKAGEIDILDAELHKKANPGYGSIIKPDNMMAQAREALASPRKINNYKRRKLNCWTEADDRWLDIDRWMGATPGVEDPAALRAQALEALADGECFGGLDLGSVSDLTAFALVFPGGLSFSMPEADEADAVDERIVVVPFFWLPKEGRWRKHRTYAEVYRTWIRQGFILETPGERTDYDRVRKDVVDISERFMLRDLAIDRYFQADQLMTQLKGDGIPVTGFGLGYKSMAAPCKRLEEYVIDRALNHLDNPVLRWMAANVTVDEDPAGNFKPKKPKHNSPLKIDGIVSLLMALGRWMEEGEEVMPELTVLDV